MKAIYMLHAKETAFPQFHGRVVNALCIGLVEGDENCEEFLGYIVTPETTVEGVPVIWSAEQLVLLADANVELSEQTITMNPVRELELQ